MSPLPDPRPPRRHAPLSEHSFTTLGWLLRSAQAVGSPRFAETAIRASVCLAQAATHAHTPAENAVIDALFRAVGDLQRIDAETCRVLSDAVSGMNAGEAVEFVEMCEEGHPSGGPQ